MLIENTKLPTLLNNRVPSPGFKQRAQEVYRSLFGSFEHVKPAVKDIRAVTPRPLRITSYSMFELRTPGLKAPCLAPAVPLQELGYYWLYCYYCLFFKGASEPGE